MRGCSHLSSRLDSFRIGFAGRCDSGWGKLALPTAVAATLSHVILVVENLRAVMVPSPTTKTQYSKPMNQRNQQFRNAGCKKNIQPAWSKKIKRCWQRKHCLPTCGIFPRFADDKRLSAYRGNIVEDIRVLSLDLPWRYRRRARAWCWPSIRLWTWLCPWSPVCGSRSSCHRHPVCVSYCPRSRFSIGRSNSVSESESTIKIITFMYFYLGKKYFSETTPIKKNSIFFGPNTCLCT